MKHLKHAKKSVTLFLAFAMVLTGITVFPTTCSAAAKKVALSKKKVTIRVGTKGSVTLKNAAKKVKWSSSQKKIVKITKTSGKKKSKVTFIGVKPGKASIIGKCGKKKYTVKVTVSPIPSNIKSITVDPLDNRCIVMALIKSKALNKADINVYLKSNTSGQYKFQPRIRAISTTDQKIYRIHLDTDIEMCSYAKVSIKSDSKEARNLPSLTSYDHCFTARKGDIFCDGLGFGVYPTVGRVQFSIVKGTLPDGLKLVSSGGIIKGIPTTTGKFSATVKAVDELNRSKEFSTEFFIYDSTCIVCPDSDLDLTLDDYSDAIIAEPSAAPNNYLTESLLDPKGGSGLYTFTLSTPDNAGVAIGETEYAIPNSVGETSACSSAYLKIPYSISEGKHTYTVTITDAADRTRSTTTTITVNVVKYYNVKGTIKDCNGLALTENMIYIYPSDATSVYDYVRKRIFSKDNDIYSFEYADYTATAGTSNGNVVGEMKGTYSAELPAGTYTVKIESNVDGILYEMTDKITVGAADTMIDLVSPVRLYTVSGIALFANSNPICSKKIFFEPMETQYEANDLYSVKTDPTGAFMTSIPAGEYVAFTYDSNGKAQYFGKSIKITDADVLLTDFKIPIVMTTISGSIYTAEGSPDFDNDWIYFVNANGIQQKVRFGADKKYSILLEDGTYTVRAEVSCSLHTLGTVVVAGVNQQQVNFTYDFSTEVQSAQAITKGTRLVMSSTGSNTPLAKFVSPNASSCEIAVDINSDFDIAILILDESGKALDFDSYCTSLSYDFKKGKTYYIQVVPSYTQLIGDEYESVQAEAQFGVTLEEFDSYPDEL